MRTFTSVAALLVAISSAAAQSWPTRPVALVVPFAAGGSSDAIGRIMADGLNGRARPAGCRRECHRRRRHGGRNARGEGRAGRLSIRDRKRWSRSPRASGFTKTRPTTS